jgi:hypothetical protein
MKNDLNLYTTQDYGVVPYLDITPSVTSPWRDLVDLYSMTHGTEPTLETLLFIINR